MENGTCYAYLLRCADGTLYAGWTNDPAARLEAHNEGRGAKYTRGRLPAPAPKPCAASGNSNR